MTGSEAFGSHFQTIANIECRDDVVEKELSFGAVETIPISHVSKIAEFDDVEAFSTYLFVEKYGLSPKEAEDFASTVDDVGFAFSDDVAFEKAIEEIIEHFDEFGRLRYPDGGEEQDVKQALAEDILLLADLRDLITISDGVVSLG